MFDVGSRMHLTQFLTQDRASLSATALMAGDQETEVGARLREGFRA